MSLTGTNVSSKIKIIITFCSCKPSPKKRSWKFTGSYEKSVEVLDDLQDTISKDRKVNKL